MSYSVVITTYNRPDLLRRCLNSFLQPNIWQLDEPLSPPETIVVSMGNRLEENSKICEDYECIHIHIDDPCSISKGINAGIGRATHEIVIVANDDIVVKDHAFHRLAEIYSKCPYAILSPRQEIEAGEFNVPGHDKFFDSDNNLKGGVFACLVISKAIFYRIGNMDEFFYPVYYNDMDYLYRAELLGLKYGFYGGTNIRHFHGSTVKGNNTHPEWDEKNTKYYMLKWGGMPCKEVFKTPFNL